MLFDSLYLVGSRGTNFNLPDGAVYCYNPSINKWAVKSTMPSPALEECAVCVWHNLIVTIGGSTSGFNGPTDIIRTYNPIGDIWMTSTAVFYQPVTCSAAECSGNYIIVVGGWGGYNYTDVIKGSADTLTNIDGITWERIGNVPYPTAVYRVSSGQFWGNLIFGPALYYSTNYNQFWAFNFNDTSWHRFLPDALDSVGNIATFAANANSDSAYFYFFGGTNNQLIVSNRAEKFVFSSQPFGIHGGPITIPAAFKLYQNYPNPFNPTTTIKFSLPPYKGGKGDESNIRNVTLKIYDVLGREVATLVNENKYPGVYSVQFDGSKLSSGIYFYRLIAGDFTEAKKMVIIK